MKRLIIEGGHVFDLAAVASLDVDAQNGFTYACPDELPVEGGEYIAPALNRQAQFASKRVGSKDTHPAGAVWEATSDQPQFSPVSGYPNVDIRWAQHCVAGTKGHQFIADLPHPSQYDFLVNKGTEPDMHPYGVCYQDLAKTISTGLIEWLTVKNVQVVIVGGLATDYCVKESVLELLEAGFTVVLNLAAVRGIAPDTTAAAIDEMRARGTVVIESPDELQVETHDVDAGWVQVVL